MNLLEVQNLKVHFPVKHGVFSLSREFVNAVDDVSFSIAPGETQSMVGPQQSIAPEENEMELGRWKGVWLDFRIPK